MVKHTQKINQQSPTNCLSVFDHFVLLVLKELTHFKPIFPLHFKHQETCHFLILEGIERENGLEMY